MPKERMQKRVSELPEPSRRHAMRVLAAGGAAAVAGCLGGDDDDDGNGGNGGNGANGDDHDPSEVQPGGTLEVGMKEGVQSLDGRNVTGLQSFQVSYNIYSKLLRYHHEGDGEYVLQGDLATSWEWEDDTTLVFELDEDAVFHNGDPVTADDVVYTFESMYDDPAHTASLLFAAEVDINARDDHTVEFDTGDEPFAALESTIGFIVGIMNEEASEAGDMALEPIGSGPFEFVEWVDGSHITLERFDDYWKEDEDGNQLPYLDEIEFTIYPDESTKMRDLETGGLDWIDFVPAQDVESARSDDSLHTVSAGPGGIMGIFQFNTVEPPFDDPEVRQAMLHTIDFEAIINIVFHGNAERAPNQALPPQTGWVFDDLEDPYQGVDLERANELLEGKDPESFEFENWVPRGDQERQQIQEMIQEQIQQAHDIQYDINREDRSVVFEMNATNQFGLDVGGFNGMWDPDQLFSANLAEGAFFNYGGYVNEEIDEMLADGRSTTDEDERREIYREVYATNNEEAAKYYPYWIDNMIAMQPYVNNFEPLHDQTWWFEGVWKSE
ncbi:ABC transporter substrate-binding protein [Natrialbaceae archaeon A-chndr2]